MLLLIDNYDSFTFNLVQAFESLGMRTMVKTNDAINAEAVKALKPEGLVISPGPGRPSSAGNSESIIEAWWQKIPILGVCLGHQCIGSVFKTGLRRARPIIHGKTSLIFHTGRSLFEKIPSPFPAARYHSLSLKAVPSGFEKSAWTDSGEIMAIRHYSRPLFGLQFHPESFLTPLGNTILENFLNVL